MWFHAGVDQLVHIHADLSLNSVLCKPWPKDSEIKMTLACSLLVKSFFDTFTLSLLKKCPKRFDRWRSVSSDGFSRQILVCFPTYIASKLKQCNEDWQCIWPVTCVIVKAEPGSYKGLQPALNYINVHWQFRQAQIMFWIMGQICLHTRCLESFEVTALINACTFVGDVAY